MKSEDQSGESPGDKLESSKEHAQKAVEKLVEAGDAAVQGIRSAITNQRDEYVEAVKSRAMGLQDQATEYCRANPLSAMATAFGLGFLAAVILRR